jgi:hypothetical protein
LRENFYTEMSGEFIRCFNHTHRISSNFQKRLRIEEVVNDVCNDERVNVKRLQVQVDLEPGLVLQNFFQDVMNFLSL